LSADRESDLTVTASLDKLQEVRSYIDRTGALLGVNEQALGDLRLAVDEAVTNVILYGYGDAGGNIEIDMHGEGDAVVIRIRDRARAFRPDHVNAPQLDTALKDRPFGGMGIFLIKEMTDAADYLQRPGGGNELRLVKRGAIAADR